MNHDREELSAKAAEVRQCLVEAVAALGNFAALEIVARYALDHSEIEWEPVALAAVAVNALRNLTQDDSGSAVAPLSEMVILPLPPATDAAACACQPASICSRRK